MNPKLLAASAVTLGLELSDQQYDACELLLQELLRWNRRINLTAITGVDEMTVKHLIDSLHLAALLNPGEQVLDVGSGAGFPALVLAIVRPDCAISSIDAVGKKISFQKHISRLLRLENFEALHGRVEALAAQRDATFDLVTSRAFSSLSLFVSLAYPLARKGGRIVSMRSAGGGDEAEQLRDELAEAACAVEAVLAYQLPMKMGDRRLVVLRKAA